MLVLIRLKTKSSSAGICDNVMFVASQHQFNLH